MTDLRTLAQAVVDARKAAKTNPGCGIAPSDESEALMVAEARLEAVLLADDWEVSVLAALDAERAQGYAAGYDEGINDGMTK